MTFRSQPGDQLHKIFLRHRRATSSRPIHAAANMKKNRAPRAGHWWIGIVPNLNEPVISEITRAHFFVCVIIWRILRINDDVAIVVRRARVVAPNVRLRHLMVWIVATDRQMCFVSKNLTNLENACRRATIALFLSKTGFILPRESSAPGEPVFSKQHWKRSSHRAPITAARAFKESQLAAHGTLRGCDTHDELRAIVRNAIGVCMDAKCHQQADHEPARYRHKKECILVTPSLVSTSAARMCGDSFLALYGQSRAQIPYRL